MKTMRKIIIVLVLNLGIVVTAVLAGDEKGNIYHYFQERIGVTFLSSMGLALTSLCALTMSFIRKESGAVTARLDFWLLSAAGFFYLSMDEYFMLHEGMDTPLVKLLGNNPQDFHLDALVFVGLAVIGMTIAWKFREEILMRREFIVLCVLATVCLGGMIVFDMLDQNNPVIKVTEESFKITGVSFFFTAYLLTMFAQLREAISGAPQKEGTKTNS